MTPRSTFVPLSGHEMHVTAWGDPANPPVVCWHGLARTGRDFDELANALAADHLVLCPDTIGRGLSTWAFGAPDEYAYGAYQTHALALLDHFGVGRVKWVGTSMGGLLGLFLAAGPLKDRMTRLVVNDIGPFVPAPALTRIRAYVGNPPRFADFTAFKAWLRDVYAPFGPAPEAFWDRMAATSVRRADDGAFTVHYDPRIVAGMGEGTLPDLDLWPVWDGLALPTLVIRGLDSDVLPADVAAAMTRRGPRARLLEVPDTGHAPTLTAPGQIAAIRAFLAQP